MTHSTILGLFRRVEPLFAIALVCLVIAVAVSKSDPQGAFVAPGAHDAPYAWSETVMNGYDPGPGVQKHMFLGEDGNMVKTLPDGMRALMTQKPFGAWTSSVATAYRN